MHAGEGKGKQSLSIVIIAITIIAEDTSTAGGFDEGK